MLKLLTQAAIAVMKKGRMLPCLLLTALLAGCNNEEKVSTKQEGEIVFNLSMDGTAPVNSRAVADMNFTTYGFDIAGYGTIGRFESNVNDLPDTKPPVPNIFNLNDDGIAVPHITKNADGFYKSPLSKVPLLEGSYLSFFAWSQNKVADKSSGIIESTDSADDTGFPYLKMTVPSAPLSQFDIVAAKSINHENDYVISAVDLDFNHILSKLTFRASSSTGNRVKIDEVKLTYGSNKVYSGGTFTFGSSNTAVGAYGAFTGYHTGQHSLGTNFAEISNGSTSALGELVLLPQELTDGFASLDITYRVVLYGAVEQSIKKSVPLKALSLTLGTNYIITLNITGIQVTASEGIIAPWIDGGTSLPLISGPRGDVLLLLDANDAPYTHVDGKKYWFDRSGYNRHSEIIGNVTYNSNDKAYSFPNTTTDYVLVPAMGNLTAATLQLVAATPGGNDQNAFFFSDQANLNNRVLFTHLPYKNTGTIFFDTGGNTGISTATGRISTNAINAAQLRAYSLYTYRKGGTFMGISRNDTYHLTANDRNTAIGAANYNYIGRNFNGTVKYLKLTQRSLSPAEVSIDYTALKHRCSMPDEPSTPADLVPPVRNNLILCLDARSGRETVDGKPVWRDQSPAGNHAQILNDRVTWSSATKSFTFQGIDRTDRMRLSETFNMNNFWWTPGGEGGNMTIEIVVKPADRTNNWVLDFSNYNPEASGEAVHVGTRMRLPSGTNQVFWGAADYGDYVNGAYAEGVTNLSTLKQYSFRRNCSLPINDGFMVIRQNNKYIGQYPRGWPIQAIKYMNNSCFIGGDLGFDDNHNLTNNHYQGEIMAIRMYARALTDEELQKNWEHDKAAFNIPD